MKKSVTVLKLSPGKEPVISQLKPTIKAFRKAISIESCGMGTPCAKEIEFGIYVLYNKDGYIWDLPSNRRIGDEIICGTFFVVGIDKSYFPRSLTEDEVQKYSHIFARAEYYSDFDIMDANLKQLERSLDDYAKL